MRQPPETHRVSQEARKRLHVACLAGAMTLAAACQDSSGTADLSEGMPFERTEQREPCDNYDPLRQPLFGDLHVHTAFSYDATVFGVRGTPGDSYRFARGEQIEIPGVDRGDTLTVRLDRSLDFAAVTDHAEFLGEVQLCTTSDSAAFDHPQCNQLRTAAGFLAWGASIAFDPPTRLDLCGETGGDCLDAALSQWGETQAAAENAYDRGAACEFTSFVGYEHTAQTFGVGGSASLHRNVIFRNANVPDVPASYFDTGADGAPPAEVGSQLWAALDTECADADFGCEALTIPHNPNGSGGLLFLDPADAEDARQRRRYDALVEITQVKGASECRFDRLAGRGAFTTDELCAFEQMPTARTLVGGAQPTPIDEYPRRALVRSVLIDGLALGQTLGVNPFQFGLIGSTDTHTATAGAVDEANWPGAGGRIDASRQRRIAGVQNNNPGGLTGVWAEENSRDAVFSALRRREAWATSGPRIAVRLFAGEGLDPASCDRGDAVAHGYDVGVPMGAELGDASSARLLVMAMADPGTPSRPGTDLQAVQIIKGWVDEAGATHERVFDIAGDLDNGASVNPETCEPVGDGHRTLCAVFDDPDFDPGVPAFYYARVLENPTCRWSTHDCMAAGVSPFDPNCAEAAAGGPFVNCCLNASNHASITPTIRERAWTSPIWFVPPSG